MQPEMQQPEKSAWSSLQHCYAQRKKEVFENIPLSRRTVTRRVEDIAGNLEFQLQSEVGSFDFFSLALDESCDVRDTNQQLIFLRG